MGPGAPTDRAPPDGPYVLVVEDDVLTQYVIAQTLREEGHQLAVVPSGQEALELVQSHPPTVILLDLRLEDMSGVDFMNRYRQTPAPHAPVVLVTAEYKPEQYAAEIGAAALLPKPFELEELIEILRPFVARPPAG